MRSFAPDEKRGTQDDFAPETCLSGEMSELSMKEKNNIYYTSII
jgi:hypothetical protein